SPVTPTGAALPTATATAVVAPTSTPDALPSDSVPPVLDPAGCRSPE
ncbi:hypothetical protein GSF22_31515, partial [Micromonospora echinofusca]|nr:hypothetical protein [Micromonospora echinofusca]